MNVTTTDLGKKEKQRSYRKGIRKFLLSNSEEWKEID